jgi:hypothetical protein
LKEHTVYVDELRRWVPEPGSYLVVSNSHRWFGDFWRVAPLGTRPPMSVARSGTFIPNWPPPWRLCRAASSGEHLVLLHAGTWPNITLRFMCTDQMLDDMCVADEPLLKRVSLGVEAHDWSGRTYFPCAERAPSPAGQTWFRLCPGDLGMMLETADVRALVPA